MSTVPDHPVSITTFHSQDSEPETAKPQEYSSNLNVREHIETQNEFEVIYERNSNEENSMTNT